MYLYTVVHTNTPQYFTILPTWSLVLFSLRLSAFQGKNRLNWRRHWGASLLVNILWFMLRLPSCSSWSPSSCASRPSASCTQQESDKGTGTRDRNTFFYKSTQVSLFYSKIYKYISMYSMFVQFLFPKEYVLEAPFLRTRDFTVFLYTIHFNTWMVTHPNANCGPSDLPATGISILVKPYSFRGRKCE